MPANIEDAFKIVHALKDRGFEAKLAGGCVRDRCMGLVPTDFDIASAASTDVLLEICTEKGWTWIPTGIDHGTASVLLNNQTYEVTTLRRDVENLGRKAQVSFSNVDFHQDAARRDFTVNAMYEDEDGKIWDYFDGIKDISEKIIRFVGDPEQRIQEDYLRILRLYRFWAKLGFQPTADARQACRDLKSGLIHVSAERITRELVLLLNSKHAAPAWHALIEDGLGVLLFENLPSEAASLDELKDQFAVPGEKDSPKESLGVACVRLALIYQNLVSFSQNKNKLRLSNAQREFIETLLTPVPIELEQKSLASILLFAESIETKSGEPDCFVRFWLPLQKLRKTLTEEQIAFLRQNYARFKHRLKDQPKFPTSEIMEILHLPAGRELGKLIFDLRAAYLNGEWKTLAEAKTWLTKS